MEAEILEEIAANSGRIDVRRTKVDAPKKNTIFVATNLNR